MGRAGTRSGDVIWLLRLSRIWFAASLSISVSVGGAAAAEMQRMALVPGCHAIGAGQHFDLGAYCLDQSLAPPPWGAVLSYLPASWDNGVIKATGAAPMTLSDAVSAHLIEIEGLGDRRRVRIVNQGGGTVEICVKGPTVAIGNGATYVGDLDDVRDQIGRLLKYDGPSANGSKPSAVADRGYRADVQQKLWDAVNAAADRRSGETARQAAVMPLIVPGAGKALPAQSSASKCAGEASTVRVCIE